jgi:pyridoxamine 5'-phosphate oxidase
LTNKENLESFIRNERHDFSKGAIEQSSLMSNPADQLKAWLKDAIDNNLPEPYAVALATSANNKPTTRIVYVRGFMEESMVFYTNYNSKKGKELAENPSASLCFYWAEAQRQVRVEGTVQKAPKKLSDEYFASRPRQSQIGAWASEQSENMRSRAELEEKIQLYTNKFKDTDVPRPDFWGGYIFTPHYYEFWQGRTNRLHDRITYSKEENNWKVTRLFP